MDDMTKKLKTLEKETAQWKNRWEKSNSLLLEMANEKKQRDAEILSTTKQLAQLEKLCRALQNERVSLISEIKRFKPAVGDQTPSDAQTEGVICDQFEKSLAVNNGQSSPELSPPISKDSPSPHLPESCNNSLEKTSEGENGAEQSSQDHVTPVTII